MRHRANYSKSPISQKPYHPHYLYNHNHNHHESSSHCCATSARQQPHQSVVVMGGKPSLSRCKSTTNVPKTIDQCIKLCKSRPRPSSIKAASPSLSSGAAIKSATTANSAASSLSSLGIVRHVSRRPDHHLVAAPKSFKTNQNITSNKAQQNTVVVVATTTDSAASTTTNAGHVVVTAASSFDDDSLVHVCQSKIGN